MPCLLNSASTGLDSQQLVVRKGGKTLRQGRSSADLHAVTKADVVDDLASRGDGLLLLGNSGGLRSVLLGLVEVADGGVDNAVDDIAVIQGDRDA